MHRCTVTHNGVVEQIGKYGTCCVGSCVKEGLEEEFDIPSIFFSFLYQEN